LYHCQKAPGLSQKIGTANYGCVVAGEVGIYGLKNGEVGYKQEKRGCLEIG
jgi:hypothetical protein